MPARKCYPLAELWKRQPEEWLGKRRQKWKAYSQQPRPVFVLPTVQGETSQTYQGFDLS